MYDDGVPVLLFDLMFGVKVCHRILGIFKTNGTQTSEQVNLRKNN